MMSSTNNPNPKTLKNFLYSKLEDSLYLLMVWKAF